jgi:hypothetical protein
MPSVQIRSFREPDPLGHADERTRLFRLCRSSLDAELSMLHQCMLMRRSACSFAVAIP